MAARPDAARKGLHRVTCEVILEDPRWAEVALEPLAERAYGVTLTELGLDPETCETAIVGCDDARIALLNADFRGKPAPTNVLSWPAVDLSPDAPGGRPARPEPDSLGEIALGDIAIAYDTCRAEANAGGIPLADHATHLIVHGLLHLLGHDHIDDADAELMERLEVKILGKMGIDNPYNRD